MEVDFDGDTIFGPVDDDSDIDFTRAGVEVAVITEYKFEVFGDINWAEADNDDAGEVDGYELGIGARSEWPTEPGWGPDWSGRISYFDMEEDETLFGFDVDDEVDGFGLTLKGGAYYALELQNDMIISPHGGLFYSMRRGDEEVDAPGLEVADLDLEYDSFGVYAGARLNPTTLKDFVVVADIFVGSSSLIGFMLSAGIRF